MTPAPCLYHGTFNIKFILFLRIVDDFSIACALEEMYILICDKLDLNWQGPMSRYDMMKHFNGIDFSQSTTRRSISSKTYLDTIFKNYEWENIVTTSLPMNLSNEFVRVLDSLIPLEPAQRSKTDNGRFCYRAAIGEIIWPMITTHPERSQPVVKISRFVSSQASTHYDAAFGIFQDLYGTRNDGLAHTHKIAMTYDPIAKHAPFRSTPIDRIDEQIPKEGLTTKFGYSNSDRKINIHHQRFIFDMVF
jgi:hypothetical protein